MACGKTVFFILAILASVSCAPTEKDRSSREDYSPLEREPPPYHQTPLDDSEGHLDSHRQNIRCEHHVKAEVFTAFPNAEEENDPPKLDISPQNCSEDYYNRHFGIDSNSPFPFGFGSIDGSSPLIQLFQKSLQGFLDPFGLFFPGFGENNSDLLNLFTIFLPHSRTQRSIQLPGDVATEKDLLQTFINAFGMFIPGSAGNSSDLLNLFSGFLPHSRTQRSIQHPGDGAKEKDLLQTFINAFGMFIPGSGGNSSDVLNLFSGFLPHSRTQRSIKLPGEAENGTEDINLHDRIFFELFNSFLHTFFQDSSSRYVSIGCNFTSQAGYSCTGCREQMVCNPNNIGSIRICPRNAPYCYNGVCGSIVNTTACTTTTTTTV